MRPTSSRSQAADELLELRLMRDMLREALGLSEFETVARITAAARTSIIFHQAEEARWGRERAA